MNTRIAISCLFLVFTNLIVAQNVSWPEIKNEARPAARWWWLGSAVDKENLSYNLNEYAKAGLGALEITPIYGVVGNEKNEINFLSPKWMETLAHTETEANSLGIQIDMNTGTGWPFGGPEVSIEDAATKIIFQDYKVNGGESFNKLIEVDDEKQKPVARLSRLMAFGDSGKKLNLTSKVDKQRHLKWTAPRGENWRLIAAFTGKTFQMVKRAAPGGEGYMMDHLSKKAVSNYLNRFEKSFSSHKTPYPHNFFNDSYEVYQADWTPGFFDQFAKQRGYKLEDYLPEFLDTNRNDVTARIVSDYRETMAELLIENFTRQWTDWAHRHGSQTRNQAHGSPGNLIDLYATVDIPECEGFGMSDFHIKGLRRDSLTRPNDSDLSMLKYASSAAHIAGKPYTSSETFTWLTEHFRTSLSQCKPDLDLIFVSGVNHMYYHGTTYSPRETQWPGWKFYASIDMSPTNSIWRDVPAFNEYISRCQSFLQMGRPDNDFLIYLPVYDMWHEQGGRMLMFDIHGMAKRAPKFIDVVHQINESGFDVDYISDNFIRSTCFVNGKLQTKGGSRYQAIIIPAVHKMPEDVLAQLIKLAKEGAKIVFVESYPGSVPGYAKQESRQKTFDSYLKQLPAIQDFKNVKVSSFGKGTVITGSDYGPALAATGIKPEVMKTDFGLQCIRRSNDTGHHYFIAALQGKDTKGWITLGVNAQSAVIFDPVSGEAGKARIRQDGNGTAVWLDMKSGESLIVRTYSNKDIDAPQWKYVEAQPVSLSLENNWQLAFVQSEPAISGTYPIGHLTSWTELPIPESKINMGTGKYSIRFQLPQMPCDDWVLNLGDVRESARVRLNGQEVATLWCVPYEVKIGKYLKTGENLLEVEVTNLPANRIADYDRRGVDWRKFKEINFVDLNYKKTGYGHWQPVPSGLLGPVKLIPVNYLK